MDDVTKGTAFCSFKIRDTMQQENNNVTFISKNVNNVAVRWNKDLHGLNFISTWDKRIKVD